MSVDGTGNFERDDAYNILDLLLHDIVKEIRRVFSLDSSTSLYDDRGEAAIIANIDILLTLCDHYKTTPSAIRQADEVTQWKEQYLSTYNRTIHLYSKSSEYVEKRRTVIVETFDKLFNLVKERDDYLRGDASQT